MNNRSIIRYHKIMEHIWLALSIVSLSVVVSLTATAGWHETFFFYLLPVFCFLLFLMRRKIRKKLEKESL